MERENKAIKFAKTHHYNINGVDIDENNRSIYNECIWQLIKAGAKCVYNSHERYTSYSDFPTEVYGFSDGSYVKVAYSYIEFDIEFDEDWNN